MLHFAKDVMLILPQGSHPAITERVAYFDDVELRGRWDDPRVSVPEYSRPQPAESALPMESEEPAESEQVTEGEQDV